MNNKSQQKQIELEKERDRFDLLAAADDALNALPSDPKDAAKVCAEIHAPLARLWHSEVKSRKDGDALKVRFVKVRARLLVGFGLSPEVVNKAAS